jgi:gas vesicle protein
MSDAGGSRVAFFLAGLGIGAVLALLFAPRSGKETRDYIGEKADVGKDFLTSKGKELREQAEEWADKGKNWVARGKDRLAEAVQAGKQAYRGKNAGA